ncbi:MAG: type II toxin-antitoxin system VapC family toxin [Sphingomonadaceae bacterium]
MISVDTHIVIRLIVRDDPRQCALAERQAREDIFVSHGVLMEAEWVLRSAYAMSRAEASAALADFVELRHVIIERIADVRWALDRYAKGAEFADMLHLIASHGHEAFATFEKSLAAGAGSESPVPVKLLK